MLLNQFKELAHLVALGVLAFSLNWEGTGQPWMHVLPVAPSGAIKLKTESLEQAFEVTEADRPRG